MSAERNIELFPQQVFESPVLRGLDETSRHAIEAASSYQEVAAGHVFFEEGDVCESFYVVLVGSVELEKSLSTERAALRIAHPGDTFGEEATLPGLSRRTRARASVAAAVISIPVAIFRRAVGRSGGSREAEREKRYLHRSVTQDVVLATGLATGLGREELDILLDSARLSRFRRGQSISELDAEIRDAYLVVEGLVELESLAGEALLAGTGAAFGGEEDAAPMRARAVGETWCLRIPAFTIESTVLPSREARTSLMRARDGVRATPLALKDADAHQLHVARELLVIDQELCVRCGHCSWSCSEVHGESRLVRRGQIMAVQLVEKPRAAAPTVLSLPNACQHCSNAACMVDCPTAAIGRGPDGEVFIRESLCTGCGSCATACSWGNISMSARASSATLSNTVAAKCELCRGYAGQACVQACPTEAIFRIRPARDIREVQTLFGAPEKRASLALARAEHITTAVLVGALLAAASLAALGLGLAMQRAGYWYPAGGYGLVAGIAAGVCMLALLAYFIPKRFVGLWMRKTSVVGKPRQRSRSRMRPQLTAHIAIGIAACAGVISHAGLRSPGSPAGALHVAFWMAALSGLFGAWAYRSIPRKLTRLETGSALPEDLSGRRQALLDSLYRQSSGREELVKAIASRVLVPYSRSVLGGVRLLSSRRTQYAERARLRGTIEEMIAARGSRPLLGLDSLIETVVELRALPMRRFLSSVLRGWLPIHIVAIAMASVLLVLHVAFVVGR